MASARLTVFASLLGIVACGGDSGAEAKDIVREHIASLAPSANIGHRGTGPTRSGHPFPENSISSFMAAITEGADGVELDVEITKDGQLIVMHDDTVDRTTNCAGCVSEMTFAEIRACRLLDGEGEPTEEHPPTLDEVYATLPSDVLVNVELKVFEDCLTDTTGPEALVPAALEAVSQLGVERRTFFSSFDTVAAEIVKTDRPDYYSAVLSLITGAVEVEQALLLGQDAIHPFVMVSGEIVQSALDAGLQVNVWTVNNEPFITDTLQKGSTAIITDDPAAVAAAIAN